MAFKDKNGIIRLDWFESARVIAGEISPEELLEENENERIRN